MFPYFPWVHLLLYRRDFQADFNGIPDNNSASFKSPVPVKTKILAVELSGSNKTGTIVSHMIGHGSDKRPIQGNLFGNTTNGDISDNSNIISGAGNTFTGKADGRVVGSIKEIIAAQVFVPFFITGVDRGGTNGCLGGGQGLRDGVDINGSGELSESAPYLEKHQVGNTEMDLAVSGIDRIGAGGNTAGNQEQQKYRN